MKLIISLVLNSNDCNSTLLGQVVEDRTGSSLEGGSEMKKLDFKCFRSGMSGQKTKGFPLHFYGKFMPVVWHVQFLLYW